MESSRISFFNTNVIQTLLGSEGKMKYSPVTVSYSFDSLSQSNEGTVYPTDNAATKGR